MAEPVQCVLSVKQNQVFEAFKDEHTTEVLYGGALSGGKSYCLCAFLVFACLTYPGTTWLLGRSELKNLKATTLVSLWEVCENFQLKRDGHYKYNEVKGEIDFNNGSKILLRDLFFYPSDPECISLNGLLLTGACIDEAGELNKKVKDIVFSRCGRWKNDKYGLKPFLLMTCNPAKNFLYEDFYKPSKNHTLPKHRKFIVAKMDDNPHTQKGYKDHVSLTMSDRDYQRLVLGNWEYDLAPDSLIPYENIIALWDREPTPGKKYISADIALEGSDRLVFCYWEGMTLVRIVTADKSDSKQVMTMLREMIDIYKVDERNVCYDYDGLGQFIKGFFPSARKIVNNSRALLNENYENLKSQMYFKLAEVINEGRMCILDKNYKQEIIQELEQVRKKDSNLDRKIGIVQKAEVKRTIGRSPDFSDALAYRMLFELIPANSGKYHYIINNA